MAFNALYTGGLFHCYMLEETNCHYRCVRSILSPFNSILAKNVDPDQMPHCVASDLGLHCLPLTLLWVWLMIIEDNYCEIYIRTDTPLICRSSKSCLRILLLVQFPILCT